MGGRQESYINTHTQYGMIESAYPTPREVRTPGRTQGLLQRAIVINTHDFDTPLLQVTDASRESILCDIMIYAKWSCGGTRMFRNVPVMQSRGVHDGHVWKPRPTTHHISGSLTTLPLPFDFTNLDPASMNGDHVLVGFIDDDPHLPVILMQIPHPSSDAFRASVVGHRLRSKEADGRVSLIKHHGTFYGIDTKGTFNLDLTQAHDGVYGSGIDNSGAEVPLAGDGAHGDLDIRLAANQAVNIAFESGKKLSITETGDKATFTVEFSGDNKIVFTESDGKLAMTVAGEVHVGGEDDFAVLYSKLEEYINTVLTVATAFGPSGPVVPATHMGIPGTPAVKSSTVKLKG